MDADDDVGETDVGELVVLAAKAAAAGVDGLDGDGLVARVRWLEQARRAIDAATAHVVAEVDAREITNERFGFSTGPWLAVDGHLPIVQCKQRVKVARLLRICTILRSGVGRRPVEFRSHPGGRGRGERPQHSGGRRSPGPDHRTHHGDPAVRTMGPACTGPAGRRRRRRRPRTPPRGQPPAPQPGSRWRHPGRRHLGRGVGRDGVRHAQPDGRRVVRTVHPRPRTRPRRCRRPLPLVVVGDGVPRMLHPRRRHRGHRAHPGRGHHPRRPRRRPRCGHHHRRAPPRPPHRPTGVL